MFALEANACDIEVSGVPLQEHPNVTSKQAGI